MSWFPLQRTLNLSLHTKKERRLRPPFFMFLIGSLHSRPHSAVEGETLRFCIELRRLVEGEKMAPKEGAISVRV